MGNAGEARLDVVAMGRDELTAVTNKVNADIDALSAKVRAYEATNRASTTATVAAADAQKSLAESVEGATKPVSAMKEKVSRVIEGFGYWGAAIGAAIPLLIEVGDWILNSTNRLSSFEQSLVDAGKATWTLTGRINGLIAAASRSLDPIEKLDRRIRSLAAENARARGDDAEAARLETAQRIADTKNEIKAIEDKNETQRKQAVSLRFAALDAERRAEDVAARFKVAEREAAKDIVFVGGAKVTDISEAAKGMLIGIGLERVQLKATSAMAVSVADGLEEQQKKGEETLRLLREKLDLEKNPVMTFEDFTTTVAPEPGGGGGARESAAKKAEAARKKIEEDQQRHREAYIAKRIEREDKLTKSSNRYEAAVQAAQEATDERWDGLAALSQEFDEKVKEFQKEQEKIAEVDRIHEIGDAFGYVSSSLGQLSEAFERVTGNKRIPGFFEQIHGILGKVDGSQKSVKEGAIAGFDALATLGAGWFKNEKEQAAFMATREFFLGLATLENPYVSGGHFAAAVGLGALAGGMGGGGGGAGSAVGGRAAKNAQTARDQQAGNGESGTTIINVNTLVADKQSVDQAVNQTRLASRNNGYARRAGV